MSVLSTLKDLSGLWVIMAEKRSKELAIGSGI